MLKIIQELRRHLAPSKHFRRHYSSQELHISRRTIDLCCIERAEHTLDSLRAGGRADDYLREKGIEVRGDGGAGGGLVDST